ncbi:MAG: hypothetical protein ACK5XN_29210, partial [Bacteroidota bacterium]
MDHLTSAFLIHAVQSKIHHLGVRNAGEDASDESRSRAYCMPMKFFFAAMLVTTLCQAAEPHLPPGTKALASAAPNGRGPLALVNLNHHVLGHARVFGGKQPDLFVAGYGGPQAVHLFKWVTTAEN